MNSRLLVFQQEFVEVFSLSSGEKLESISLSGIGAVDGHANLFCAQNQLLSLRYVGDRLNESEEVTDETVTIEAPTTFFGTFSFFSSCRNEFI